MEYRRLGKSGLQVPVLSLGTGTFGGTNEFFKAWGQTGVVEATRLVDISLDHGLNFFDTANLYSAGDAERILGAAVKGRRDKVLIATKASFMMGDGPNDKGASRFHLLNAVEESLQRLGTDYIDIFFMHSFDPSTPLEETLSTLDTLVRSGKIRYIGASNYTAWQLMKALSISEKNGFEKFVVYQGYYSLIGRDHEQEIEPLLVDQGLGMMVWSPLGWGRLTGKVKRGILPDAGRAKDGMAGAPPVADDILYKAIDALEEIAAETGKTVPQVAINWLLQRQSVSNIVIGARNEQQLLDNINSVNWSLSGEHLLLLDKISAYQPLYPHWVGSR